MNTIYTAWWQGFDRAPEIIQTCHRSLLKAVNQGGTEVISITSRNIDDYCEFPGYIIDKYHKGIISAAHFSDLLRFSLLSRNGGLWADASMYFYSPVNLKIFNRNFFTMRRKETKENEITNRWTMSLIGGVEHFPLFDLLYDFWLDYWKREDALIAYLLTDNIMYIGYQINQEIHEAFDLCPISHHSIDFFQNRLNNAYGDSLENELKVSDGFFKLTYKKNLLLYDNKGFPTFWNVLRERAK